jgi:hypothetical protein
MIKILEGGEFQTSTVSVSTVNEVWRFCILIYFNRHASVREARMTPTAAAKSVSYSSRGQWGDQTGVAVSLTHTLATYLPSFTPHLDLY